MTKVLVVYGSRHGATEGIARRNSARCCGHRASRRPSCPRMSLPTRTSAAHADGFVVEARSTWATGSRNRPCSSKPTRTLLRARPVWLFSSGPLPGSTRSNYLEDPLMDALGPKAGPGSGGRKKIEELAASVGARDHRVFLGRYDPDEPPQSFPERIVRMLPMAKGVLPHGDFRNWRDIEAWALEIAATMTTLPPVLV